MEIRQVDLTDGQYLYVVVDEGNHKVTLFQPFYLEEVVINSADYIKGAKGELWPDNDTGLTFDVKKIVLQIESRVRFFRQAKRSFPISTTMRVLAALKGEAVSKIESNPIFQEASDSGPTRASVSINQRWQLVKKLKKSDLEDFKGRRREILEVLMKGPASITAISDVIKYQPKTKVAQDPVKVKLREVKWALENDLKKKGLVDVV